MMTRASLSQSRAEKEDVMNHRVFVRAFVVAILIAMLSVFWGAVDVNAQVAQDKEIDLFDLYNDFNKEAPVGKFSVKSDSIKLEIPVSGFSRYSFLKNEYDGMTGSWEEQGVETGLSLLERFHFRASAAWNHPCIPDPVLRELNISAFLYKKVKLTAGQLYVPFGREATTYTNYTLPIPKRVMWLSYYMDKGVTLDAPLTVPKLLGEKIHVLLFAVTGQDFPNLNDNNEPHRDYGARFLLTCGKKLELGMSLSGGKCTVSRNIPLGNQGDWDTHRKRIGLDFRWLPAGRNGALAVEGEWLTLQHDQPFQEDLSQSNGYLRGIYEICVAEKEKLEVVSQVQYFDPDAVKESLGFYGGINFGAKDGRWRVQLGGTVFKERADEVSLVLQLRF